ncbi:MAG: O-antigen ligase family protein [Bacteroidia bacterium]
MLVGKNLREVFSKIRPDLITLLTAISILASLLSLSQAISFQVSVVDSINFIFWQSIIWFLFQFRNKIPWILLLRGTAHGLTFSLIYHLFLDDYLSLLPFFSKFGQNGIAYIAIAFIPLAVYYYVVIKKRNFTFTVALFLFSTALIGSRAGFFIVCLEVILLYIMLNNRPSFWQFGVLFMLLIGFWKMKAIFAPLLGLFNEDYALLLADDVAKTDTSALVRLAQIEKGFYAFMNRPLFGYGINSFKLIEFDYRSLSFEGSDLIKRSTKLDHFQAHNSYITLMVEMGGIITFIFLSVVVMSVRNTFRYLVYNRIFTFLLVGILGSIIHLFFIDIILSNSFWFHLGVVFAISKLNL